MIENLPTAQEVERAASLLRSEAARLAVWHEAEITEQGMELPARWEAPGGGEPAPGAAVSALGHLKVAETLEGLVEPLMQFEEAMRGGAAPMDVLFGMMGPAMIGSAEQTTTTED